MYTVYGTQNNILNGQHCHIVIWLFGTVISALEE